MRVFILALLTALSSRAADVQKLALETAAQADFDAVLRSSTPDLASAAKCVQSQAMLLAIATPGEAAPIVFRQGYCSLASAAVTQTPAAFGQAAEILDNAVADTQAASARQKIPQRIPFTWHVLASVARLNAGAPPESQEQSLAQAVDAPLSESSECQANAAAVEFCHSVNQLGSAWLGWMALRRGDPVLAERRFAHANTPGWTEWVDGLNAVRRGNYAGAASAYGRAMGIWREAHSGSLAQRLNPRPAMPTMLTDWGGAQLAANDPTGALTNLDVAVKADAANARALYWRGLAKQQLGRNDAAVDDLNLASRAAFAESGDAGVAEAHFYRGIVLYWRKEFVRAENEFASALNADIVSPWPADARAWRYLAAVAGGACGASRDSLAGAMASASPYFPKTEAHAALAACPLTAAALPNK